MKHMVLALSVVALAACSSAAKKDAAPSTGADSAAMRNQSAESAADGARLSGKQAGSMDMFGAPESGELLVVHFPFDSSTLTEEAQANLRANAEFLRQHPEARIVVEGHTDERGADEYNLALGERRAKAVRDYLTLLGIDSSRMQTVSYGSQQPAERGASEEAYSKNRRAQFRELN